MIKVHQIIVDKMHREGRRCGTPNKALNIFAVVLTLLVAGLDGILLET